MEQKVRDSWKAIKQKDENIDNLGLLSLYISFTCYWRLFSFHVIIAVFSKKYLKEKQILELK